MYPRRNVEAKGKCCREPAVGTFAHIGMTTLRSFPRIATLCVRLSPSLSPSARPSTVVRLQTEKAPEAKRRLRLGAEVTSAWSLCRLGGHTSAFTGIANPWADLAKYGTTPLGYRSYFSGIRSQCHLDHQVREVVQAFR